MIGLLPDRPQRGKGKITNLKSITEGFEVTFNVHCRNVVHRRITGEKALQSFLIGEAQTSGRRLASLNSASAATDDPVELHFITDEISLPVDDRKTVCDVLGLRRDGGRFTPVLLELKDRRQLARLVEQVDGCARLIDEHADLFAELFGALLGEAVAFDGPTEKWIVWPAVGTDPDPRTQELLERGIRVAGYTVESGRYAFIVGPKATGSFVAKVQAIATERVESTDDPRITHLRRIGAGEGFATYRGQFEGRPALIVDSGTLADILGEDDAQATSVAVQVFENAAARDGYIEDLEQRCPAALGAPEWAPGKNDA